MHYDPARSKYVVRYREDGRRRTARFDTRRRLRPSRARAPARRPLKPRARRSQRSAPRVAEFEVQLAVQHDADALGDGVFVYSTKRGTGYGFKFRQSDGTSSTRRGFTSRRAVGAAKGGLEGSIRRGEIRVGRESFTEFWDKLLADRKPYPVKGSYEHGNRRAPAAQAVLRPEEDVADRRGARSRVHERDGRPRRHRRLEAQDR